MKFTALFILKDPLLVTGVMINPSIHRNTNVQQPMRETAEAVQAADSAKVVVKDGRGGIDGRGKVEASDMAEAV